MRPMHRCSFAGWNVRCNFIAADRVSDSKRRGSYRYAKHCHAVLVTLDLSLHPFVALVAFRERRGAFPFSFSFSFRFRSRFRASRGIFYARSNAREHRRTRTRVIE